MDYDGYGVSEKQAEVDGVKYKERTWRMAATKEVKPPPLGYAMITKEDLDQLYEWGSSVEFPLKISPKI